MTFKNCYHWYFNPLQKEKKNLNKLTKFIFQNDMVVHKSCLTFLKLKKKN